MGDNKEESKEGEKEQDDIKTKKGKVSESFQERNKKHEKEDQILIKKSIQNGEETAKFEDTKDENEIIEKETKKKVSDIFEDREKIKSENDEKIIIKPKVKVSNQNQQTDIEEIDESDEEEDDEGEEKESKVGNKLSINDLRSSIKIKLDVVPENNLPKRKKSDIQTEELSFDDFPDISEPTNVPKKKKIADEFHEKVKIEQVQDDKLIIRTLPELITDNEREMNLENEDPKNNKRINDTFGERNKRQKEEEEDEEKQSKIKTKKKLSITDLRSSMKVKLNI